MTMKPHETSEINIFTMENSQLQPQSVFHYFSIINKIPRPSGKEEQMMAYLHKFAKEHGLESMQDETGNVLIRKPATPGYENRKTTVLQSHMDMVCEKEAGLEFNFLTDHPNRGSRRMAHSQRHHPWSRRRHRRCYPISHFGQHPFGTRPAGVPLYPQ